MSETPINLEFNRVGDGNGALYYLGSAGNTQPWRNPAGEGKDAAVVVFASSCERGALRMVTEWEWKEDEHCYESGDVKHSWVAIDLQKYEINPKVYSMAYKSNPPHEQKHLRSWILQGSKDGKLWDAVDIRNDDNALHDKVPWVAFAAPETQEYYRWIRILMRPNGNAAETNILTLNCLELYGQLRRCGDATTPAKKKKKKKKKAAVEEAGESHNGGNQEAAPKPKPKKQVQQTYTSAPHSQWRRGCRGRGSPLVLSRGGYLTIGRGGGGFGRGRYSPSYSFEREPQESLPSPFPSATKEFPFSKLGDRGIIFYLGCKKGESKYVFYNPQKENIIIRLIINNNNRWSNPVDSKSVEVRASTIRKGVRSCVCDHTFNSQVFFTDDDPNSWIQVSLTGHKFNATHFAFSQRAGIRDYYPRDFKLEASVDGSNFETIATFNDNTQFNTSSPTASFPIPAHSV